MYSFSPVSIIQTQRRVSSGTSQEDRIAQAHGPASRLLTNVTNANLCPACNFYVKWDKM